MIDFRLVGLASLVLAATQLLAGHLWLAALSIAVGALWIWLDRRRLRQVVDARRRKAEAHTKWSGLDDPMTESTPPTP